MHIPVIACDTPGTREVLKNGLFGEIVEPSEYALANAMKNCIRAPCLGSKETQV